MASLATLRRRRLLSRCELARRAGVAPSSIYLIEKGGKVPQLIVMRKIVSALGLDDPMDIDEFRQVLSDGAEESDGAEPAIPDAAADPVLAELWDNEDDAIYDQLAASMAKTDAPA